MNLSPYLTAWTEMDPWPEYKGWNYKIYRGKHRRKKRTEKEPLQLSSKTNNPIKKGGKTFKHPPPEETLMTSKLLRKCAVLLLVSNMQITTIVRYSDTPGEQLTWEVSNTKWCWGHSDHSSHVLSQADGKVPSLWENVWQFLIKLNIHLLYDHSSCMYLPRDIKSCPPKLLCKGLSNGFIPVSKKRKTTHFPSTSEWVKKLWCVHSMEYYSATEQTPDWKSYTS